MSFQPSFEVGDLGFKMYDAIFELIHLSEDDQQLRLSGCGDRPTTLSEFDSRQLVHATNTTQLWNLKRDQFVIGYQGRMPRLSGSPRQRSPFTLQSCKGTRQSANTSLRLKAGVAKVRPGTLFFPKNLEFLARLNPRCQAIFVHEQDPVVYIDG